VAGGEVRLRGAVVEIDEATGRALRITRIDEPGSVPPTSDLSTTKKDIAEDPVA
jgi:hypothetical protein